MRFKLDENSPGEIADHLSEYFMSVAIWRMMWKDWGFAATLFGQAKHFLSLAKQDGRAREQEGYVRAAIVFSLIAFEASFFREIITGYIQQNRATIDPVRLKTVEDRLTGPRYTGIQEAVEKWPKWLTGKPLPRSSSYPDFETS